MKKTILLTGTMLLTSILIWCKIAKIEIENENLAHQKEWEQIRIEEWTQKWAEESWEWTKNPEVHQEAWLKSLDNWWGEERYQDFFSESRGKKISFYSKAWDTSIVRFAIYDREKQKRLFDCFENSGGWYIYVDKSIMFTNEEITSCEEKYHEIRSSLQSEEQTLNLE